jgi:hypothetical protein
MLANFAPISRLLPGFRKAPAPKVELRSPQKDRKFN